MTVNIVSGTSTAYNAKASQVTGSWESGTIQWSNMPTIGSVLEDNISHNNKTKYQFSCLTAVQHWYDGSTTGQNENYGIMLQYADDTVADYNSFYSADCTDATSRPSMTISYQPLNSDIRLDVGNRVTLSVTGANGVVTWTSSDTSIATVNSFGLVTGIQVGEAIITAYVGGLEFKKFTVNVTIADGVYRIANTAGLNLATYGGIAENTPVKMRSYSDSGFEELCQLWKIAYLGNGYYSIRPMHKLDMGLHADGALGSSVDIVSIGTCDTLSEVNLLSRWEISPTTDGGSYFISLAAAGSLGMTMDGYYPSVGMGVSIDISSDTQGFFKWVFYPIEKTIGGAILYDKNTQIAVTDPSRHMEIGQIMTLSELSLTASAYSNTEVAQDFYWQSSDSQVARINSSTGVITAVSSGTATINGHVYRAGEYHYVTFGLCIGYPSLFDELIDLESIHYSECDNTTDGLFLSTTSLADVLISKGVSHLAVDNEGERTWEVSRYYDDWYIYATDNTSSPTYGLYKMRETETDGYDGDDPGVTISFISFDKEKLIQCINSPTLSHQYELYSAINRVTGPGTENYDDDLAEYFAEKASKGAYLIAEKYVSLIASEAQGGIIALSDNCIDALDQSGGRISNALERINTDAGYEIFSEASYTLSISNISNMSIPEKQAILCCFCGNETFNSFAAEVLFHADAIYSWRSDVPILGDKWYGAAIRADMCVGEEYESGFYDDYYDLSSDLVQDQITEHGEY